VVTSGGRIDPNNFRLVSTSHRELVRPAEQVIWACDFAAAYIGDRRVRVRMRQAIDFAPDYLVVGGEGGRAVVELGRVQALAEAAGVDYGFTVGRAWRGDTAAISILLDLPSLVDIQNPLFEGYAELMLGLLQRFGDQLFAGLLSSLAPPVQLQAARALEGIRGRGFPLTDSLLLAALPATTDRARPPPGDNTGPFEEDVLTTRPDIIRGTCRLPHYPESMRQAGIEGRVLLELVIDTLGRVEPGSVRVISSNHAPFEAPAIFTARSCSFRPGRIDGRAVRVRVQVPINFSISRD
jgi:TonB family protein